MSSWKYWVTGKMNLMNLEKNSKHQTMQYFSWKQFFTKTEYLSLKVELAVSEHAKTVKKLVEKVSGNAKK